jgi:hypothetical protein
MNYAQERFSTFRLRACKNGPSYINQQFMLHLLAPSCPTLPYFSAILAPFVVGSGMVFFAAILVGALLGTHPMLAVPILIYAGRKLHQSEALLSCCSGYPTRRLVVYGKVFG